MRHPETTKTRRRRVGNGNAVETNEHLLRRGDESWTRSRVFSLFRLLASGNGPVNICFGPALLVRHTRDQLWLPPRAFGVENVLVRFNCFFRAYAVVLVRRKLSWPFKRFGVVVGGGTGTVRSYRPLRDIGADGNFSTKRFYRSVCLFRTKANYIGRRDVGRERFSTDAIYTVFSHGKDRCTRV